MYKCKKIQKIKNNKEFLDLNFYKCKKIQKIKNNKEFLDLNF